MNIYVKSPTKVQKYNQSYLVNTLLKLHTNCEAKSMT